MKKLLALFVAAGLLFSIGCTGVTSSSGPGKTDKDKEEKKDPKKDETKDASKKDSAKDAVKDAAKDAKDAVKDAAKDAKDAVKDAAKDAKDAVKDAAKDAKDAVKDAAKDAKDAVKDAAKDAKDAVKPAKPVDGTFVKATDKEITVKVGDKETTYTLDAAAKVTGDDGKDVKAADIKKDAKVKVTLKDDGKTATKVEVQK